MLRFAPRYGIVSPALVRPSRQARQWAANDNNRGDTQRDDTQRDDTQRGPVGTAARVGAIGDARVQAALRLFAAHGLAAADRARVAGANADARGDEIDARWWAEISHLLG
jgi:hypothetical protein